MSSYECLKCWQTFTNLEELMVHEKLHPNSMWYLCRLCGSYFIKKNILKYHQMKCSSNNKINTNENNMKCEECGAINKSLLAHLQHVEAHKFKTSLDYLLRKDSSKLCIICLNISNKLVHLNEEVKIHVGFTDTLDRKFISDIVKSVFPTMSFLNLGTKICEPCCTNLLSAYTFIQRSNMIMERLHNVLDKMLVKLNDVSNTKDNLIIEVSKYALTPVEITATNIELNQIENYENMNEEFLEDEFRIDSENDGDLIENDQDLNEKIILTKNDENECLKDNLRINNDSNNVLVNKYCSQNDDTLNKVNLHQSNNSLDKENYLNSTDLIYRSLTSQNTIMKFKRIFDLIDYHENNKFEINSDNSLDINIDDLKADKRIEHNKKYRRQYYNKKLVNKGKGIRNTNIINSKTIVKIKRSEHKCPLCCKKFISEYFHKKHILKHRNETVKCLKCEKIFNSKNNLFEHLKLHLKNYENECNICHRLFRTHTKLNCHIKEHYNISCQICSKRFISQNHYDTHLKRHTSNYIIRPSKKVLSCKMCQIYLKNKHSIPYHINKVHLQIKPFECDMCENKFYTKHNLKGHKRIHFLHSREICELCSKVCKSRKSLVKHINKHLN